MCCYVARRQYLACRKYWNRRYELRYCQQIIRLFSAHFDCNIFDSRWYRISVLRYNGHKVPFSEPQSIRIHHGNCNKCKMLPIISNKRYITLTMLTVPIISSELHTLSVILLLCPSMAGWCLTFSDHLMKYCTY